MYPELHSRTGHSISRDKLLELESYLTYPVIVDPLVVLNWSWMYCLGT